MTKNALASREQSQGQESPETSSGDGIPPTKSLRWAELAWPSPPSAILKAVLGRWQPRNTLHLFWWHFLLGRVTLIWSFLAALAALYLHVVLTDSPLIIQSDRRGSARASGQITSNSSPLSKLEVMNITDNLQLPYKCDCHYGWDGHHGQDCHMIVMVLMVVMVNMVIMVVMVITVIMVIRIDRTTRTHRQTGEKSQRGQTDQTF